MFTKYKLETFVAVSNSYAKWYILIILSTVDYTVVKLQILSLLYKLNPNFIEIFLSLKSQFVYHSNS